MDAATEEKGTETKQETVPETISKERFDEQEAKLKAAEEKNELQQQNLALIVANTTTAPTAKAEAFDIYKEVGLDPDDPKDIPNQEQQKKINAYFQAVRDRKDSLIVFRLDHPDFSRIVGTAEQIRTGQWADPLMKAIKANPTLMSTIMNSADPYAAAYAVGKIQADKDAEGDKTKTTKTDAEAAIAEAIANAEKVKSASNTKGGEGLSEKGRTENMSDADFIKEFNRIGGDL